MCNRDVALHTSCRHLNYRLSLRPRRLLPPPPHVYRVLLARPGGHGVLGARLHGDAQLSSRLLTCVDYLDGDRSERIDLAVAAFVLGRALRCGRGAVVDRLRGGGRIAALLAAVVAAGR